MLRRAAPVVALTVLVVGALSHASARPPARGLEKTEASQPAADGGVARSFAQALPGPSADKREIRFDVGALDGVPTEWGFVNGQFRVEAAATPLDSMSPAVRPTLIADNRRLARSVISASYVITPAD